MQPLPMNEFVQQNLAEVGIKVDFEVVEWNHAASISGARARPTRAREAAAEINYTYFIQDPFTGFIRHLQCNLAPPSGHQLGSSIATRTMDKLFDAGPQHLRSGGADHGAAEGPREIWWTTRCS